MPGPHRNMAIEALPLAHYAQAALSGVRCLYVYRDAVTGREGGFWAGSNLPFRDILWPPQDGRPGVNTTLMQNMLYKAFDGVPIRRIEKVDSANGSNYPFIRVMEEDLGDCLLDWRQEVLELLTPFA